MAEKADRSTPGVDLATRATLDFVRSAVPRTPSRLLEVGCGRGKLAAALVHAGHEVVAIDSNENAVADARKKGVDARAAHFPEFTSERPFDAVLFTRSLHHVDDLDGTVRRARELLADDGVVVLEDWAWEEIDDATAEWAYGLFGVLRTLGVTPDDEFLHDGDPRAAWLRERRERNLHEGATQLVALRNELALDRVERFPYFFRYAVRFLSDDRRRDRVAGAVLDTEQRLIAKNAIVAIGLRAVGTCRR